MTLPLASTIVGVREAVAKAQAAGLRIGFVPTMGALHEGHAALIRAAKADAGFVVVSIFVNPTQFGPKEDFSRYPRTLDADCALSQAAGADLVFAPSVEEMYPKGSSTFVEVPGLQDTLCDAYRPGHFRGVCTVVLKLFQIVRPDVAVFGAKDFQQSRIIQRMVSDLNLPLTIHVEPTAREADGLARSSRNRYLSPAERAAAPAIYQALTALREEVKRGSKNVQALERELSHRLAKIPDSRVDYARIVDANFLSTIDSISGPAVAAVALFLGTTRLIDNIELEPS